MLQQYIKYYPDYIILDIYVQPGSRKSQLVGLHGNALKIKISAPPEDGKANLEVIRFFRKLFLLNKNQIEIISGERSRNKRLKIYNIDLNLKNLVERCLCKQN